MIRRRSTAADERVATALNSAVIHVLRRVAREDDTTVGPSARSALSVLVFGGDRRQGDLARLEGVTAATMSRIVDGLERCGFADRRRDPQDRRLVWVTATPAGRRHLEAGRDRRVAFLAERLRRLTVAERAVLVQAAPLLERLAADGDGLPPDREAGGAGGPRATVRGGRAVPDRPAD
jgi:DNA-binding MarR family transcriptional regulator